MVDSRVLYIVFLRVRAALASRIMSIVSNSARSLDFQILAHYLRGGRYFHLLHYSSKRFAIYLTVIFNKFHTVSREIVRFPTP
jgi:hypothetical protein